MSEVDTLYSLENNNVCVKSKIWLLERLELRLKSIWCYIHFYFILIFLVRHLEPQNAPQLAWVPPGGILGRAAEMGCKISLLV